ncbi:unnamed protein product [Caenorhabditis sp. 36 PRJEB53466]|nr:unnamed protein product [Caenorhabditis sp. 36 PRJEB53466]
MTYNTKSAGVRRLMKEAMELREPTEMYHAQPMEDNLFEWHFTIRGTLGSDFEGGIYHGRIIFPADYPMKPPNLILLTPNGRFELNKKICLSISGYHPETWLPSWSIRTALLALIGFLPTTAGGALGSLEYPPKERKRLAKLSGDWKCKECGCVMKNALLPITEDGQGKANEEAKQLAAQLKFQDASEVKKAVAAAAESADQKEEDANASSDVLLEGSSPQLEELSIQTETAPEGEVPGSEVEEPLQIVDPSPFPAFQQRRTTTDSSSFDYSLLVTIPLIFICAVVFFTLFARRFLIDNGHPLPDGSEL